MAAKVTNPLIETVKASDFIKSVKPLFSGSLLALVVWSRAGGCTDYIELTSMKQLEQLCQSLPNETILIVFKERHSPTFIMSSCFDSICENQVKEMQSWIIVEQRAIDWTKVSDRLALPDNFSGDYSYELKEILSNFQEDKAFSLYIDPPTTDRSSYVQTYIGDVCGVY